MDRATLFHWIQFALFMLGDISILMLKRIKTLFAYRKEKSRSNGFSLSFVMMLQIILDNMDSYIRKMDYRKRKIPSILLITLPKSGSMYISNTLVDRCVLRPVITGDHGFPSAPIHESKLKKFALGCAIDQAHYMPTTKNLTLLKNEGIDKVVVHFRDPRQALLSWVHYMDKLHEKGIVYWEQDIELPLDYFNKSLEEKTDVMIECFYPHLIHFIDSWLSYDKERISKWGIDVLFTEFKKMKNTSNAFIEEICEFYGIKQVKPEQISAGAHSHDRKGELEEWRQSFTDDQIKITSNMISNEMLEKFGWSRC